MLGALGKREVDDAGACPLSPWERPVIRRQAATIVAQSLLIGATATLLAWLL